MGYNLAYRERGTKRFRHTLYWSTSKRRLAPHAARIRHDFKYVFHRGVVVKYVREPFRSFVRGRGRTVVV